MIQQQVGILLIENIPPQITDTCLYQFFNNFSTISCIIISNNKNNETSKRYCWIEVKEIPVTMRTLKRLWIDRFGLNIRMMGYRYPSITEVESKTKIIFGAESPDETKIQTGKRHGSRHGQGVFF